MTEPDYPEYSKEAALGNKGRRLVENLVHDSLGWLFREITKDDLGIDGFVEILVSDDASSRSRGRLFAVQIKCGSSYLTETTESGFVYRGRTQELDYWLEFSIPVVLVLCDPDTDICYWVHITPENVERTSKAWKVLVPQGQVFGAASKSELHWIVRGPQPWDLIPLALYRLLVEKFRGIQIAQELETPHDFWGFDFLAKLENEPPILIATLYKPTEEFSIDDVKDVLSRRAVCAKGCGWDQSTTSSKVFLFFVAHTIPQLRLKDDVADYLSQCQEISYFRVVCNFVFGVSLIEVDSNDEFVNVYDRDNGT